MFISNDGSYAAIPFTASDRYLQLAHPAVPDVLLLSHMPDGGDGYKFPILTGQLSVNERVGNLAALVVTEATVKNLVWKDLAFVMTQAQVALFEQLLAAQTASQPVTIVDRMQPGSPLSRVAFLQVADAYKSPYYGLLWLLVQFSVVEA
jgi:hypothetical protein